MNNKPIIDMGDIAKMLGVRNGYVSNVCRSLKLPKNYVVYNSRRHRIFTTQEVNLIAAKLNKPMPEEVQPIAKIGNGLLRFNCPKCKKKLCYAKNNKVHCFECGYDDEFTYLTRYSGNVTEVVIKFLDTGEDGSFGISICGSLGCRAWTDGETSYISVNGSWEAQEVIAAMKKFINQVELGVLYSDNDTNSSNQGK